MKKIIISLVLIIIALYVIGSNTETHSIDGVKKVTANQNIDFILTPEQAKTECRLMMELAYLAISYRLETGNIIDAEDLKQKLIYSATASVGENNANRKGIESYAHIDSIFGSSLTLNEMAIKLGRGTSYDEAKCLKQDEVVLNSDGNYRVPKYSTIINWDKTSDTNFQITRKY